MCGAATYRCRATTAPCAARSRVLVRRRPTARPTVGDNGVGSEVEFGLEVDAPATRSVPSAERHAHVVRRLPSEVDLWHVVSTCPAASTTRAVRHRANMLGSVASRPEDTQPRVSVHRPVFPRARRRCHRRRRDATWRRTMCEPALAPRAPRLRVALPRAPAIQRHGRNDDQADDDLLARSSAIPSAGCRCAGTPSSGRR